jgi:hypothetical protein
MPFIYNFTNMAVPAYTSTLLEWRNQARLFGPTQREGRMWSVPYEFKDHMNSIFYSNMYLQPDIALYRFLCTAGIWQAYHNDTIAFEFSAPCLTGWSDGIQLLLRCQASLNFPNAQSSTHLLCSHLAIACTLFFSMQFYRMTSKNHLLSQFYQT